MSETVEQSPHDIKNKTVRLGPRSITVPEDWDAVAFEEAIDLNPKYTKPDDGPFDYLPMDAVDENKQTIEYWTKREKDDCTTTWFKNGDTVYAKITPCTENGKIAFIEGLSTEVGSGSTEFLVFHPREGITDERFVYYLANVPEFRSVTISLMEGSTGRQRVPSDVFKRGIELPLPPLSEQRRIVDILSTVDEQIQQTDEIIQETRKLKKGLFNDLISTGVKQNVTTRNVKVGPLQVEIPETWSLKQLKNIVPNENGAIRTGPFGSKLKNEHHVPEGVKLYEQRHVYQEKFNIGNRHVTEEWYNSELTSYEARPFDVLITLQGTVGEAAMIPESAEKGVINPKLIRIRPDESVVYPQFLARFLNDARISNQQIDYLSHGAVVSGLNVKTVGQIKVPLPPIPEQRKIVNAANKVAEKVSKENRKKELLKELKRGLMQDLLTGKVRVDTD